jgi:hypothetical protein
MRVRKFYCGPLLRSDERACAGIRARNAVAKAVAEGNQTVAMCMPHRALPRAMVT